GAKEDGIEVRLRSCAASARQLSAVRGRWLAEPKLAEGERRLAERVGFVPVDGPSFNNLGLNSIGRNCKNTQKPGSRYKTSTVNCGWEPHPRVGEASQADSR